MQTGEADVRFIFGRIPWLRRVDRACNDYLIGLLAYATVAGVDFAMAERSDFIYPFIRVFRYDAVRGEDYRFRTRYLSNASGRDFGGLSSIRAEERTRQVRCSVGQDAIDRRQRVFLACGA